MTEFEAATLALQENQLWAAVAIPVVAGLVGLGQCGLIAWGLFIMRQANHARAAEGQRLERAADHRHTEAMRALDSQAEALRAVVVGLERQGAALEAALKGGRA